MKLNNAFYCELLQEGKLVKEAQDRLIKENDGLVHQIVNKLKHKLSALYMYDDAVQDGRLAVLRAAKTYDHNKGAFTTYATWFIRAAVEAGQVERYAAHLPVDVAQAYQAGKEIRSGQHRAVLNVTQTISLDDLAAVDFPEDMPDEVLVEDLISDRGECFAELETKDLRSQLTEALKTLTEREQEALRLRFEEDMTLEQAGKELNVTRERMRQIEAKALRKLRCPDRCRNLKCYL